MKKFIAFFLILVTLAGMLPVLAVAPVTMYRFWDDPTRELVLTAKGTTLTIRGDFDSLSAFFPDDLEAQGYFSCVGAVLSSDKIDNWYQSYFPVNNDLALNGGFYPAGGLVTLEKGVAVADFGDIPAGRYSLGIKAGTTYPESYTNADGSVHYIGAGSRDLAQVWVNVTAQGIEFDLPETYAANKARVDAYAPPGINSLKSDLLTATAFEVTAGISDPYQKAKALYRWVTENITMQPGLNYLLWNATGSTDDLMLRWAEDILVSKDGFHAIVLNGLLHAVGIPAREVLGDRETSGRVMWTEAYIGDRWVLMSPAYEVAARNSGHKLQFFDQSIEYFSDRHSYSDAPVPTPTQPATPAPAPSSWAADEVNAAISAGLVPQSLQRGYQAPISRGAVAQMLINLVEQTAGQGIDDFLAAKGTTVNSTAFTDTSDKAVLAANALGLIHGVGDGRFDPSGTLTRAQIAAIVNRYAIQFGVGVANYSHSFTDVSGHWVNTELGWPVHAGIILGVGEGRFNPEGQLTVEQAIMIIYRALLADKTNPPAEPPPTVPTSGTAEPGFISKDICPEVRDYALELGFESMSDYIHPAGGWQIVIYNAPAGRCRELSFMFEVGHAHWVYLVNSRDSGIPIESGKVYTMAEMKALIARCADYQ